MALAFAPQFDLRKTCFLVAGIAGVNPEHGTSGSAAWSDWLVDFGLQWWEIDGDGRRITACPRFVQMQRGILVRNTDDPEDRCVPLPGMHRQFAKQLQRTIVHTHCASACGNSATEILL